MKLLPLALLALSACANSRGLPEAPSPLPATNQALVALAESYPEGGGYEASDAATNRLQKALQLRGQRLVVDPAAAFPAYCSGATYLVLVDHLASLPLPPAAHRALLTRPAHPDGEGVFGRFNANGPGTAVLFHELGAGRSFTDPEEALPGDFLKLWWTEEIGKLERGHLVLYLGHDEETLTYWSGNQPEGFSRKTIPRARAQRLLFTRLTRPQAFAQAAQLPARNGFLADMLRRRFTWAQVAEQTGLAE
ncbi:MAG: hypothetical protein AAF555_11410 [Verrucomicrobiota bacterium]